MYLWALNQIMYGIMKRLLIITMVFWNLFFNGAAQTPDWANKARYAQSNLELQEAEPDPMRVVLMGNSITEFWEETHPDFFKNNHLVGRGIGGQVSSQMLARFRQDVINLNPRIVVINCGTNDIAENNGPYEEDITMDNIKSMTELATAHGITVVLSTVLPCDGFCWNPSAKDVVSKIQHLNQRIKEYAGQLQLPLIDYYPSMSVDGSSLFDGYTEDGVHPNARGYDQMEALLLNMVNELRNM